MPRPTRTLSVVGAGWACCADTVLGESAPDDKRYGNPSLAGLRVRRRGGGSKHRGLLGERGVTVS